MSVVKSKRNRSKVEFFDYAYRLVEEVTKYLLADFGTKKSYNNLKAFCYKARMTKSDKHDFEELVNKYSIELEVSYPAYILDYYRKLILDSMTTMISNISHAYTMYPNSVYEYGIKRQYQTDAISCCYDIKHHLQLSIRIFTPNLEKYIPYIGMIDKEIELLKQWRKECVKLRKTCYENDERLKMGAFTSTENEDNRKNSDINFLARVLNINVHDFSREILSNNMNNYSLSYDCNGMLKSNKYIPAIYYIDSNNNITNFGISNL